MTTETKIGEIGNYYGGLSVRSDGTRHEWGIENYNGTDWEEIPESLYSALTAFEASRRSEHNCPLSNMKDNNPNNTMPNDFSFKSFEVMLRAANAEPPLYCSYGTVYSVLREGDDEYCVIDDSKAMQWIDSCLFIKTD